jgi:hypothetical protein
MNWIWSLETLLKKYHYKEQAPEIFSWIVGRICRLYPGQAGEVALKAIEDRSREARWEAAVFFKRNPDPVYMEQLEKVFMKSTGEDAGLIAEIFAESGNPKLIDLFRGKYPVYPRQDVLGYMLSLVQVAGLRTVEARSVVEAILSDLPKSGEGMFEMAGAVFEASLNAGVPLLTMLNLCSREPVLHPLFTILLIAIGDVCGLPIEASDLAKVEAADGEDLELPELLMDELDLIETNGEESEERDKLEELFKKEKYGEVVKALDLRTRRLIERKKAVYGEGNYSEWWKGRGIPRRNIEAISAFCTVIGDVPAECKFSIASAAVYIFSKLLELESLVGRPFSEADIGSELACFLEDRSDVEEDEARADILKIAVDRERVIDACFHELEMNRDSACGDRVVEFLCRAGVVDREIFGRVVKVVKDSPYLWDSIVPVLRDLAVDAPDILLPLFADLERGDWRLEHLLEIMGDLPVEESVRVILDNWEYLWSRRRHLLLVSIHRLGDRRFLVPLRRDLKEGELYDGEVYCFLSRLNGMRNSFSKRVEKDISAWRKRMRKRLKYLADKDFRALLREPVAVGLICRECGQEYHYEVHKVNFSYETEDVLIRDTIRCKQCGAVDNYDYDPYFRSLVFQLGLNLADIENLRPEELADFVIEPVEFPLEKREKRKR